MATVHLLTTADEQVAGCYSRLDFERLVLAAGSDRFQKHSVIESPDSADIILFVGSTYPDWRDIRSHRFLRRYRHKCFLFHSDDYVIPFLPGVFVNIPKRWYSRLTMTGPYLQMFVLGLCSYVPS